MKTVYTFVPSREHEYPNHPEKPGRLDILDPLLDSLNAEKIEATPATHEQVARVHQPQLIKAIEEVCKQGAGIIDHAPTYVTQTSYQDALLAAGGAIACTRAVLNGDAKNAFAIVRPPGHHAEPDRPMGFCIFNNIAIAAREALATGMERVMVIDYDAHHGNGTQAACMDDERFGFISTHQWGIYPGTGWISDAPHAKGRLATKFLRARLMTSSSLWWRSSARRCYLSPLGLTRIGMIRSLRWDYPRGDFSTFPKNWLSLQINTARERSSLCWKAATTRAMSPTGHLLSSTH